MSSRGKVWLIGLGLSAFLAGSLAWNDATRDLAIPMTLLSLGVIALVAEAAGLRSLGHRRDRPRPPEGARPADGVVDVVAMSGVEASPLPTDPRWRRFSRIADEPRRASGIARLSRANPSLLGRVTLISVFVGRDGRPWSDLEIAQAHDSMINAGLWIEREASRREAPVNVGLADTFFQVEDDAEDLVEVAFTAEGDDVGPMEADASTKGMVAASRAAAQLGFVDVVDLMERINLRVEADARIWLFHLRRAGRSLAIPASDGEVSGVGLALCYAREASFPEPLGGRGRVDPTTVAHELLHLFGASDKYGVSLRDFAPDAVSSREIMRLNFDSLARMRIDTLTASEIGWGPVARDPNKKTALDR
jgi:hypothetical protein